IAGHEPSPGQELAALATGMALVLFGVVTCIVAAVQYRRVVAELGPDEIPRGYRTGPPAPSACPRAGRRRRPRGDRVLCVAGGAAQTAISACTAKRFAGSVHTCSGWNRAPRARSWNSVTVYLQEISVWIVSPGLNSKRRPAMWTSC